MSAKAITVPLFSTIAITAYLSCFSDAEEYVVSEVNATPLFEE